MKLLENRHELGEDQSTSAKHQRTLSRQSLAVALDVDESLAFLQPRLRLDRIALGRSRRIAATGRRRRFNRLRPRQGRTSGDFRRSGRRRVDERVIDLGSSRLLRIDDLRKTNEQRSGRVLVALTVARRQIGSSKLTSSTGSCSPFSCVVASPAVATGLFALNPQGHPPPVPGRPSPQHFFMPCPQRTHHPPRGPSTTTGSTFGEAGVCEPGLSRI